MRLDVQEVGAIGRKDRRDVRRHVPIPVGILLRRDRPEAARWIVLTLRGIRRRRDHHVGARAAQGISRRSAFAVAAIAAHQAVRTDHPHVARPRDRVGRRLRNCFLDVILRRRRPRRWPATPPSRLPRNRSGRCRSRPARASRTSCASSSRFHPAFIASLLSAMMYARRWVSLRWSRTITGTSAPCPTAAPPAGARGRRSTPAARVHQDRIHEPELPDAGRDLRHLLVASACAHCGRRRAASRSARSRSAAAMAGAVVVALICSASSTR